MSTSEKKFDCIKNNKLILICRRTFENVLLNRSIFGKYNVRTFNVYLEADSQCLRDDIVHEIQILSFGTVPQSVYSEDRVVNVTGVKFEKVYDLHHSKLKETRYMHT